MACTKEVIADFDDSILSDGINDLIGCLDSQDYICVNLGNSSANGKFDNLHNLSLFDPKQLTLVYRAC